MSDQQQQLGGSDGNPIISDDGLGDTGNIDHETINDGGQGGQDDGQINDELAAEHLALEDQARSQGWVPKEEFKGHPDDHKTARHYIEWGEMQANNRSMKSQMNTLRKSHEDEIVNLNIINKANTDRQIQEVKVKLNTAIEDGETDTANALVKQHADLVTQKNNLENAGVNTGQVDETDIAILRGEWEEKNPWFFNPTDPRVAAAHSAYNLATARGLGPVDAFKAVDERIAEMGGGSPRINQKRNLPGDTTSGGGGGGKTPKNRKLSMSDIHPSELPLRSAFPDGEEGTKIFLTSVENMRKGA